MPDLTVDINVYCSCGEGLCNQSKIKNDRYGISLTVEPCQKCLDRAKDSGKDEGESEGYDNGYRDCEKEKLAVFAALEANRIRILGGSQCLNP